MGPTSRRLISPKRPPKSALTVMMTRRGQLYQRSHQIWLRQTSIARWWFVRGGVSGIAIDISVEGTAMAYMTVLVLESCLPLCMQL